MNSLKVLRKRKGSDTSSAGGRRHPQEGEMGARASGDVGVEDSTRQALRRSALPCRIPSNSTLEVIVTAER
ncbi:hypothetical protein E2C01_058097 [Portunus trituberculatus]|uniref:Uncharacterized protein n=1 Tax=Portunus trituberculatus TaxID=210409 RepID=A0A5B7H4D5_PORTR|nr:hypothetical protein [Portunus trituberculatus]